MVSNRQETLGQEKKNTLVFGDVGDVKIWEKFIGFSNKWLNDLFLQLNTCSNLLGVPVNFQL